MTGKDFEDRLVYAFGDLVEEDGVVMTRKQSFSQRRGKFEAAQEVDIMVDSPRDEYYIGVEAKSRKLNDNAGAGMYFSAGYGPDQFEKQLKYRDRSGRRLIVAVELKDFKGEDSAVYLCPVQLFTQQYYNDRKKVTWEQIAATGVYVGDGDNIVIAEEDLDEVETRGGAILEHLSNIDDAVEKYEDSGDWFA